jgi:hypothetical protein
MERIERPDGLVRIPTSCALDDLLLETQQCPVTGLLGEDRPALRRFDRCKLFDDLEADQTAVAFDEREIRGVDEFGTFEDRSHGIGAGFSEEPRQDRAGLRIDSQEGWTLKRARLSREVAFQAGPLSSSSIRCTVPSSTSLGRRG